MSAPDSSMVDLFRQELETQTELLNEGLLLIERGALSASDLDGLMRAAHSVKGSARIVGFGAAERLAHALEDCFVAAGRGDLSIATEECDLLLAAVDLLQSFGDVGPESEHHWMAERGAQADDIVEGMDRLARSATHPGIEVSGSWAGGGRSTIDAEGPDPLWEVFVATARPHVAALRTADDLAGADSGAVLSTVAASCERLAGLAELAQAPEVERVAGLAHRLARGLAGVAQPDPRHVVALRSALEHLTHVVDGDRAEAGRLAESLGDRVAEWSQLAPLLTEPPPVLPVSSISEIVVQTPVPPVAAPRDSEAESVVQPVAGLQPSKEPDRFVRVSSENLDQLMGLSAETLVQVNWLQKYADSLVGLKRRQDLLGGHLERLRALDSDMSDRARSTLGDALAELDRSRDVMSLRLGEIEEYARLSLGLSERLYHEVLESRMRPLGDGLRGLKRAVRDLGRSLDKTVHLEFEGEDTQVDRDVLERLEAPIDHLLRNAVDHGIEPSAERIAAGKPTAGQIQLSAGHRAGMLSIQIEDDGGGIDVERIRQKLVDRGIASEEVSHGLSDEELLDYLFMAGFSTSSDVTEVSGRGVGLDVVRESVGAVGGSIHVVTCPGEGTTFQLELPLTLSVVRTLLVRISGQGYALPLARVEQVLKVDHADTFTIQHHLCCEWNGHNVGLVQADRVLELPAGDPEPDQLNVVCIADRSTRYGICVDEVLGEQDLVVRPIDHRLGKVADVSAAATTADGSLVVILDVDDMTRSIARLRAGGALTDPQLEQPARSLLRPKVLVADDSPPVRELEARKLEQAGYEVVTAIDGEEAWAQLAASRFDLLVSDVDMPNLNGFELVQRIKATPRLAELPVMLVSYNETDDYRREGLAHGADRYVTKSEITTGRWLESVLELIGQPSP